MDRDFVDCPEKSDCQKTIRCCDCEVYAFELFNVPMGYYITEDELNEEYDSDDGDIMDDDDEPCGNLYAPGSEECDWCKWSDQCYQDYVYWTEREERRKKVKK
jgi:hypothetical protein